MERIYKSEYQQLIINKIKMIRILALIGCFIAFACVCFAQDVIVTRDSRRINALVTQVNVDDVRFKYFDNQNGSTYMLQKKDILTILYQNGKVETFETESRTTQLTTSNPAQTQYQRNQTTTYPPVQTQNQRTMQPVQYQSQYQDIVYMKDGSVLHGIIIEQIPNQSITIETTDRNVYIVQMSNIETMIKVPYNGSSRSRNSGYSNSMGTDLRRGFKGIVELGYLFGFGKNSTDRLKLNFIAGYQANPYFSFGFGIGIRPYSGRIDVNPNFASKPDFRYQYDVDASLIPILADFRVNFMDDNLTSPYLSLGVGYAFNTLHEFNERGYYGYYFESKLKGGFLFNLTAGFNFKIANRFAINAGLGYEVQRINISIIDDNWSEYENHSINSDAISIVFGISF